MKRIYWILILSFVVSSSTGNAGEKEWKQLKSACERCYGGLELLIDIDDHAKVSRFTNAEKNKLRKMKRDFLIEGTQVLGAVETYQEQIEMLKDYIKLKGKSAEGGTSIIDDIMKIKLELAETKAKLAKSKRQFEAFIQCGNKLD